MNFVVVACDMGPSNALQHVMDALTKSGHGVDSYFGRGSVDFLSRNTEEYAETFRHNVKFADKILLGISSTPERSKEELTAAKIAIEEEVPFGFFCNTFGEFRRPWFREVMKEARFLFVLSESEIEEAADFAPKARIIASGNPDWATYFKPVVSRQESRRMLGVSDDTTLVLAAGSKEMVRNALLWGSVVMAVDNLELKRKFQIALCRHPGESNPENIYHHMLEWSDAPISFLPGGMGFKQALPGADIVVTSLSATGIEAACQRKPVIDFATPLDRKWWEDLSGSAVWPPVDHWETSILAGSVPSLTEAIMNSLLGRVQLAGWQAEWLEEADFIGSAEMIADALAI